MTFFHRIYRDYRRPSLTVFVFLQILDVLTTLIGTRLGASEASTYVNQLMQLGPVKGLLLSKGLAVVLALLALYVDRPRLVVFLNFWFAGLVSWNLVVILTRGWVLAGIFH